MQIFMRFLPTLVVMSFAVTLLLLMSLVVADQTPILPAVSLNDATKKIIAKNNNKVLEASTQLINDNYVHVIKILTTQGRVQSIKIDMNSGKILQ